MKKSLLLVDITQLNRLTVTNGLPKNIQKKEKIIT